MDGHLLHLLESSIRETRRISAEAYRKEAEAWCIIANELKGEEWRDFKESMVVKPATLSRMLTVARTLPESVGRFLSSDMQYTLAKAVRDGYDLDTILPYAESLSVSAFREEILGIERKVRGPEELECPQCKYDGPKEDFVHRTE